jgi:hypothetical protein
MSESDLVWEEPQQVSLNAFRESFLIRTRLGRIGFFLLPCLIVFIFFLVCFFPLFFGSQIEARKMLGFVVGGFSMALILVLEPWLNLKIGVTYTISEQGIGKQGLGTWFRRWEKIQGFDEVPTELEKTGKIILKSQKRNLVLYFPEFMRGRIVSRLGAKTDKIDITLESGLPTLSFNEWGSLFLASLGWCCAFSIILVWQINNVGKVAETIIMLLIILTLFFGPGTLGIALLFGKEAIKNRPLRSYMILFNILALVMFAFVFPVVLAVAALLK